MGLTRRMWCKLVVALTVVMLALASVSVASNYTAAKEKALEELRRVQETGRLAKETAGSWIEWAKDKSQDGLGLGGSHGHDIAQETEETAERKGQASEKAHDAAKQASDTISNISSKKAAEEKAKEGYDTAKREAEESLETAKCNISSNHDAAKHKAQEMAADAGGGGRSQSRSSGHDEEL